MKKNEGLEGSEAFELDLLQKIAKHPLSMQTDKLFEQVIPKGSKPAWMNPAAMTATLNVKFNSDEASMKDDEKDLTLGDDLEFDLGSLDDSPSSSSPADQGLDLNLDDGMDLSLSDDGAGDDLSLSDSEGSSDDFSLGDSGDSLELSSGEEPMENLGDLDFGNLSLGDDDASALTNTSATATEAVEDLGDEFTLDALSKSTTQTRQISAAQKQEMLGQDDADTELSPGVQEKLKEIDAILDSDSRINIRLAPQDLNEPLVVDELSDSDLGFTSDDLPDAPEILEAKAEPEPEPEVEKTRVIQRPKKKKQEVQESSEDFREISGAYSGELERLQATISNLRADRDELLTKIQILEDEKILHNRQTLSTRAELDERKIELSIIRRKLNDEISELKDKMRVHEERRLILEEKNRLLHAELDKANQKNKLDVKKVQLRERELEQKLELLKADAETQIRHRDLKILELKRKIDAMEFDMESMNSQEKRSVESRFELEDKLEKAIRTLRSAITVLEDENDNKALETLKKNIDI